MTKTRVDYLLENKCKEKDCYNYSERGYIYCVNHLHGFPHRMDTEDIAKLKAKGE